MRICSPAAGLTFTSPFGYGSDSQNRLCSKVLRLNPQRRGPTVAESMFTANSNESKSLKTLKDTGRERREGECECPIPCTTVRKQTTVAPNQQAIRRSGRPAARMSNSIVLRHQFQ